MMSFMPDAPFDAAVERMPGASWSDVEAADYPVLGALVLAAEAIAGPDGEAARRRFRRVGDRVFSEEKEG